MVGAWERELRARRLRAAAERWDVERERAEAVERARQAAMSRREVVPPTQVAPEVRQAERRSFWDRLPTGTPRVRPVEEQPTVEEFATQLRPAGQLVSDVLFGPEVESIRPGTQQAGLLERFARTQAGEQEFRTAAERFGEGRPGSGLAWGLLGLAGAVPFFGDIAQGAAGVSRAVRGAEAVGDVARAVPRITVRADDVERVEGMGEHWFRVTDPDNPRGRMTLPGTSGGGRLGGRPMPIEEVPDEIYHVTTNAPGVRNDGIINVSAGANRGAGGTSGSGAISTTASREVAETLQSDLRAFAGLKNTSSRDDVLDLLIDASSGVDEADLPILRSEILRRVGAIESPMGEDVAQQIFAKRAFDAWQFLRYRFGGSGPSVILGNPFSDYWRSVRPEDIDIIPVNKNQIPEGALINDYDVGRGGLEEIQVYADIPLAGDVARGARFTELETPRWHGTSREFAEGETILPRSQTGAMANYRGELSNPEAVYLANDPGRAYWFGIINSVSEAVARNSKKPKPVRVYETTSVENPSVSPNYPYQETLASAARPSRDATDEAKEFFEREYAEELWEVVRTTIPERIELFAEFFPPSVIYGGGR